VGGGLSFGRLRINWLFEKNNVTYLLEQPTTHNKQQIKHRKDYDYLPSLRLWRNYGKAREKE